MHLSNTFPQSSFEILFPEVLAETGNQGRNKIFSISCTDVIPTDIEHCSLKGYRIQLM